jgi:hypothetical protein
VFIGREKTVVVLSADYLSMNWAFPLNKKTQRERQRFRNLRKKERDIMAGRIQRWA